MPVTAEQVKAVLDPDEPNYGEVKALGTDALPILQTFVHGPDMMLASKAAYAAGLIGGDQAVDVVLAAARHPNAAIRVAAAGAAAHLEGTHITAPLLQLLDDADSGVRRQALHASAGRADPALHARIEKMSTTDMNMRLRAEASAALLRR
jgi:HEAT repeat protein